MNENLNEMQKEYQKRISNPAGTQSTTFSFDDVEFDPEPRAPVPVKDEKSTLETDSISFASETDLIQHTREIMKRYTYATVMSYWEIGRSINSFYQGKYGSKELDRIAEATGVGRDTLAKACKFAKQFNREQVSTLLDGRFPLPWNRIAQNLSVKSDQFVETYQQSETPDQFYNGIIRLKDPDEKRGKSRLPGRVEPEVIDVHPVQPVQPEIVELEDTEDADMCIPEDYPVADDHDQEEIDEQYRIYAKELQDLRDEVARLTSELTKRDMRIKTLEIDLAKANRDLDEQYDRAEKAEKKIEGVVQICERGGGPVQIMGWLESDD